MIVERPVIQCPAPNALTVLRSAKYIHHVVIIPHTSAMPVMSIRVEKGYLRHPPALLLIASISPLVVEETNVLLDKGDA